MGGGGEWGVVFFPGGAGSVLPAFNQRSIRILDRIYKIFQDLQDWKIYITEGTHLRQGFRLRQGFHLRQGYGGHDGGQVGGQAEVHRERVLRLPEKNLGSCFPDKF